MTEMIGRLIGNYKILEKIGEGGMGDVWRGIDVMLDREVAIKVLKAEFSSNPQLIERFRSEAVTLARLNHPNIATLYAFLRQGNDFFMMMEYVPGETLGNLISRSGAIPCAQALPLFCQALEGIHHAHSMGIIHRDLKPSNLMFTTNGSIKVMDFGIARALTSGRMTRTGHLIGTLEYMAPELIQGQGGDVRSDIYALGLLLYEMLTGRLPFQIDNDYALMKSHMETPPPGPRTFAQHLPDNIDSILLKALEKRPEARYQSAAEFRSVLIKMIREASILNSESAPLSVVAQAYIKATRLSNPESDPNARAITERQRKPFAALLEHLNWRHYAAFGAFLLAILAVPFLVVRNSDKQPASQPAPVAHLQPAVESQVASIPVKTPDLSPPPTTSSIEQLSGPTKPLLPMSERVLPKTEQPPAIKRTRPRRSPANANTSRAETSTSTSQPQGEAEAAENKQAENAEERDPEQKKEDPKEAEDQNTTEDKKVKDKKGGIVGKLKKLNPFSHFHKKKEKDQ
jgi:serine/threonine protein kinase